MIGLMEQIARDTMARLSRLLTDYLPGLLAGLLIMLAAWCLAVVVRTLLVRIFRGERIDRFLRRSGLASLLPGDRPLRATQMAAKGAYWTILAGGFLLALSGLDAQLITGAAESILLLLPKLIAGALILVAGIWISRYLGRSALIWAFNEGIPSAHRIAQAVRVIVLFVAVVAVADYLNFARNVFLAAFILLVGGAVLAGALAFGLAGRKGIESYLLDKRVNGEEQLEPQGWKHL